MKKIPLVPVVVIVVLMALAGVGYAVWSSVQGALAPTNSEEKSARKGQIEQINVLPVSERPYLRIVPTADGRSVEFSVLALNAPADSVDYLLEYQTGELLQGVTGSLQLARLPATTKQLLGSCSAGGACTYHENVSAGSVETRFQGDRPYHLRQDWRFFTLSATSESISSRNTRFQLSSDALAGRGYAVVLNSPGVPEGIPGELVSDPYALGFSRAVTGTATVSIKVTEAEGLTLVGWDGSQWNDLLATYDTGREALIAEEASILELYAVVR